MELAPVLLGLVILLGLNASYFIPQYLIDRANSHLAPTVGSLRQLFVARSNQDPWRISIDLLLAVMLYRLVLSQFVGPDLYSIALFAYFACTLVYHLYYVAFRKIYLVDPTIYHDWFMMRMGLQLIIHDFKRKYQVALVGLLGFMILAYIGVRHLVYSIDTLSADGSIRWLVAALFLIALTALRYPYLDRVVVSPTISFARNVQRSIRARRQTERLTLDALLANNDKVRTYNDLPNIYFIVVESYGKMVVEDERFREDYMQVIRDISQQLAEGGRTAKSILTDSPVLGGASWLSYTTMTYGLRVDGHASFLALMNMAGIDRYDSLFNWLRRLNYTSYRASGLGGYKNMSIPYDKYSLLYGVDRWITHDDLQFEGREYGFGPSPPDQFTLNFAQDEIDKSGDSPTALFFISQNSHSPFDSPEEISADWNLLNSTQESTVQESTFWARPPMEKYGHAIKYQLSYLSDFICKRTSPNDLVILVGDHQPPGLDQNLQSFETPLHVITGDKVLASMFEGYGFGDGMLVDLDGNVIKQEAILSLIQRVMIERYAQDTSDLPEFRSGGISIKNGAL